MRPKISAIAGYSQIMTSAFSRFILVSALCALAAACATSPEQQAARDETRCTERGYKPQTKQHDDCVSGLASSRDARLQRQHRELVERPAPTYGPGPGSR